jgi:hypothetical protein
VWATLHQSFYHISKMSFFPSICTYSIILEQTTTALTDAYLFIQLASSHAHSLNRSRISGTKCP